MWDARLRDVRHAVATTGVVLALGAAAVEPVALDIQQSLGFVLSVTTVVLRAPGVGARWQ